MVETEKWNWNKTVEDSQDKTGSCFVAAKKSCRIFSDSHVQQNKKETTCCTFKLPVRRWIHSGVFQICENKIVTERIKTAGVFSFDLWRTYVLVVFGGGFPLLRKFVVFD